MQLIHFISPEPMYQYNLDPQCSCSLNEPFLLLISVRSPHTPNKFPSPRSSSISVQLYCPRLPTHISAVQLFCPPTVLSPLMVPEGCSAPQQRELCHLETGCSLHRLTLHNVVVVIDRCQNSYGKKIT